MFTEVIHTDRLAIHPLTGAEASFIYALVNSEGWLRFIGDRNVRTEKHAEEYVANLLTNPEINYWVVKIPAHNTPIGVVTLIKKEYLSYPDIGFSFLPAFEGKGYAFEATRAVLQLIKGQRGYKTILACTKPQNTRSIRLLERLDMKYWQQITVENEVLQLYKLENDA